MMRAMHPSDPLARVLREGDILSNECLIVVKRDGPVAARTTLAQRQMDEAYALFRAQVRDSIVKDARGMCLKIVVYIRPDLEATSTTDDPDDPNEV